MEKLDNVTVVIPVHSVEGEFATMFKNALDSIRNNKVQPAEVLIVRCACGNVKEVLNDFDYSDLNVRIVQTRTSKDFQSMINSVAEDVTTEYFSFLEFDDEYSNIWFKNVKQYIEVYPDVDLFLPIISNADHEHDFYGYSNEAVWAYNFSDELGYLDHDVLLEYPSINIDGMVIKTEVFKELGGLKTKLKLSFNYEFLLRLTYKGKQVMVIPKIGYKHINFRENSLFWQYRHSENETVKLTPDEANFWMEAAKDEFYFVEDREIIYVKKNELEDAEKKKSAH